MPRFIEKLAALAVASGAESKASASNTRLNVAANNVARNAIGSPKPLSTEPQSGDTCQFRAKKGSTMDDHGERERLMAGISGELTPFGHRIMARVYYADTDFSGVVYHARYLEFFERGRSDFLRLAGVHHTELADGKHGEKLVWIVRRMEIDFRGPARIDDILTVDTRTEEISGARIRMGQQLKRGEEVLVEAKVEAAIIGENGRPRRFPREWIEAFMPRGQA
jgi:acyl-CoA thioester hydrolase